MLEQVELEIGEIIHFHEFENNDEICAAEIIGFIDDDYVQVIKKQGSIYIGESFALHIDSVITDDDLAEW